jgi:hypothetical protein
VLCCALLCCALLFGCVCGWTDDLGSDLACLSGNQQTGWYIKILAAVPNTPIRPPVLSPLSSLRLSTVLLVAFALLRKHTPFG